MRSKENLREHGHNLLNLIFQAFCDGDYRKARFLQDKLVDLKIEAKEMGVDYRNFSTSPN